MLTPRHSHIMLIFIFYRANKTIKYFSLVEQPRISSVSNGLEGTFGNGQTSVNIATPEFQIAY